MVNATGYMPGNEIAVKTPDLLGAFYARSPNHLTSIQQLPLLTEWASFPGDNSLKIIEVIKHHIESLVTGKRTAEQVMPELVGDVSNLLPKCRGEVEPFVGQHDVLRYAVAFVIAQTEPTLGKGIALHGGSLVEIGGGVVGLRYTEAVFVHEAQ